MWDDSAAVVDVGDGESGGAFRSFQSFRRAPHGGLVCLSFSKAHWTTKPLVVFYKILLSTALPTCVYSLQI